MVERRNLLRRLVEALDRYPVVTLLGARQCGKTTAAAAVARLAADVSARSSGVGGLARSVSGRSSRRGRSGPRWSAPAPIRYDLENPVDLARLANPFTTLSAERGLVILDEVQTMPALYPILRVLADRPRRPARFLLLGSASPELVTGISESLAGRAAMLEMAGFDLREIGSASLDRLWLRGGLPRSYLARNDAESLEWRDHYIRTFLERDIPQLGISIPAAALRRFWTMIAHFHGQIWNAAEFARALGSSESTARRYLNLLTGAFVVRQLQPWHANIRKRQVKAPKVYVRDTGVLHALLSIASRRDLMGHPKVGASWEGFALEQALGLFGVRDVYFWRTHAGAELDLYIPRGSERIGLEFKFTDAPVMTKSLHVAIEDLNLTRAYVVYPGSTRYRIADRVEAVPIGRLPEIAANADRKSAPRRGGGRRMGVKVLGKRGATHRADRRTGRRYRS